MLPFGKVNAGVMSGCAAAAVCYAAATGRFVGEWRSLVAHLVWDQRVAGSNPVSPTKFS